jgi:maltose/moltooligosaccharide transporter
LGAQAGEGVGVGVDAILELNNGDRKETAYATRSVYLPWEYLPLIAIANNAGSLPLLICAILITLLAVCMYRTMTVAIVADITPRPLRTKADSVQKIVGYADTGVMLAAISVMVPNVERPDYLPLFLLQAAFVLVSAVVYGLLVKEPALVQKMHQKSLEMGIREDEVEKDDSPEAGGKERVAE